MSRPQPARPIPVTPPNIRYILVRIPLIYIASLIGAIALNLFVRPALLAPGGISGVSILLNETLGFSVPITIFVGNVIMLAIGYRQLGGWNTVIITAIFVVFYSLNIQITQSFIPPEGLSDERLLNTIYSGVVGGVSGGLIYRLGGTMGGSSILSRILNTRFGIPTSSGYLYVDSFVILAAGLVFDWEASLYSLLVLVIDGFVADYVLEGPSLIRVVTVITDKPTEVSTAIMTQLSRGVTSWEGQGRYTNKAHHVLFVTVTRAQVTPLTMLIHSIDAAAFIVVGTGHAAYGSGFKGRGRAGRIPRPLPSVKALVATEPEHTPAPPTS